MRVLYVIDSLAPGGAERSLAALAPHLASTGVELHVVPLADRPGVQDDLLAAGAVVDPALNATRHRAVGPLVTRIAAIRPDLVHTTLFEADVAGRIAAALRRVPSVTTFASVGTDPGSGWETRLRCAIVADAATARLARRFHAVSEVVAATMAKRLRLPRHRIDVVHRGRDPGVLGEPSPDRRQRTRSGLGVEASRPMVLAVARHEWQKGLDVLVAAWPEVAASAPGATLVVAGRCGEQTPALQEKINRLGLVDHVRLLGARDDVGDLLVASDAFVLPSRWEGLPGALLEAMALGTPAVATDIPEVREVLGDPDLALLVPVGDPGELARAVVKALVDPRGRDAAVAGGRQRFLQAFTSERSARGMVAFYERALER